MYSLQGAVNVQVAFGIGWLGNPRYKMSNEELRNLDKRSMLALVVAKDAASQRCGLGRFVTLRLQVYK